MGAMKNLLMLMAVSLLAKVVQVSVAEFAKMMATHVSTYR